MGLPVWTNPTLINKVVLNNLEPIYLNEIRKLKIEKIFKKHKV